MIEKRSNYIGECVKKVHSILLFPLLLIVGSISAQSDDTITAICFDFDHVIYRSPKTTKQVKMWFKAAINGNFISDKNLSRRVVYLQNNGANSKKIQPLTDYMRGKQPIPGTVTIIKQLHAAGHELFTATNQGTYEVQLHRKQDTFLALLHDGMCAPDTGSLIKKPSNTYFVELKKNIHAYCAQHHPGKKVRLIFIDDKAKNTQAAQQHGFETIICNQNPHQLRAGLRKLNVYLTTL
jgi:FMN phosphatase YigB (HAD superfamily)